MEQEYYRMPRRRLTRSTTRLERAAIKLHRFIHANLGGTDDGRSNSPAPTSTRPNSAGCSTNCRTKWSVRATGRDASNSPPHIENGNQQVLNKHGSIVKKSVLHQNLPQAKSDSS